MSILNPSMHIGLAIAVYFLFALLSVVVVRRAGTSIADMEGRTARLVPFVGLIANLAVLLVVLLMLSWLDRVPAGKLGFAWGRSDGIFLLAAVPAIVLLSIAYLFVLERSGHTRLARATHPPGSSAAAGLIVLAVVLVAVAAQEEILFRGYIAVNLRTFGWPVVLAVSTALFVVIHFATNRVSLAQAASWTVGGLLLGVIYLVSGSIIVAIVIHFIIDLMNVVLFNITGRLSIFQPDPPMTPAQRALFRTIQSVFIVALLLLVYGPAIELPL